MVGMTVNTAVAVEGILGEVISCKYIKYRGFRIGFGGPEFFCTNAGNDDCTFL